MSFAPTALASRPFRNRPLRAHLVGLVAAVALAGLAGCDEEIELDVTRTSDCPWRFPAR